MVELLVPTLCAVGLWWLGTGIVLYLDGLPRRTFPWSLLAASLMLPPALWVLAATASGTGVADVYLAFVAVMVIWGWHELSYYTGYVTGPRKHRCAEGCRGWRHFGHALGTSLWHELALAATALGLGVATLGGENAVAFWSFLILWVAHESARINVFLGVRNVNAGWLPPHLAYLDSFLRRRAMNPLFPVSVIAFAIATGVAVVATLDAPTAAAATRRGLYAALLGLAVVEHAFLMLPVPLDRIWQWGLRSRVHA